MRGDMLTVRDALELPAFDAAEIVAGDSGLDNVIRWVHIVDIPEATFDWARGGELLLTSGVPFTEEPGSGESLIASLAEKGLAGVVLSRGHALERAPERMRRAADEQDLPLIEVPPDVPFIELTEAVFTYLVDQQYALHAQAEDIHRELMNLVLEGDTLQGLAEALASFLDRSVAVESEAFDVLASSRVGPVDEARKRSVAEGRTTPELAERLLERGIYERLLEQRGAMRVPPMPDLGMTMERIVAPIIVARRIIGYVWIIAGDRDLTELDELAIGHAATAAAVLLLKEREVQDAELRLRGDLLDQLLALEGPPRPELVERVQKLGFHANRPYEVTVIQGRTPAGESQLSLPRKIERWLNQVNGPALVVPRGEQVVVLLQSGHPPQALPLARRLVDSMDHPAQPLRVGVGEPVDELVKVRRSYGQAAEALRIAQDLGREPGVYGFRDLGLYHWLHHLAPDVLSANPYLQAVRELARHDRQHNGELLTTLEAFLEAGGHRTVASAQLNIHRNTLAYRLERIQEELGLDPTDPTLQAELVVALRAYRLRGEEDQTH